MAPKLHSILLIETNLIFAMDIVSTTHDSKFPKRNSSKIFNESDKENISHISNSGWMASNTEKDLIDLSEKAKESLANLENEVQTLIEKHPMHASMFFSKNQTSHTQELANLSSLLRQPSYQQLIDRDPKFLEFYERVIGLGEIYQDNLHRYQNDLRSTKPLTYSQPYGLE